MSVGGGNGYRQTLVVSDLQREFAPLQPAGRRSRDEFEGGFREANLRAPRSRSAFAIRVRDPRSRSAFAIRVRGVKISNLDAAISHTRD